VPIPGKLEGQLYGAFGVARVLGQEGKVIKASWLEAPKPPGLYTDDR
jgi:hypothetical protein